MTLDFIFAQVTNGAGLLTPGSKEFLFLVYLPIALWVLIVFVFFVLLLRKYTFGNWTKENPNPFHGESFNMPRGIFRGVLTLTLLFVVIFLELVNVFTPGFEDEIHQFMLAFQMMIAFYFGSKVMHHITSTDRRKVETVSKTTPAPKSTPAAASKSDFDDAEAAG